MANPSDDGLPPGWEQQTRYSIRKKPHSISRASVNGKTRYTAWRLNPKTNTDKDHPQPTLLATGDDLAGALALCQSG